MENNKKYHLFWNGPFSNWYPSNIIVEGVAYNCTEQHMMAEKAKMFGDKEMYQRIMMSNSPADQKAYGKKVKDFNKIVWETSARDIVYKGNLCKFTQHADLKEFLLGTGNDVIVEASPYDVIWGIGLHETDKRCLDPKQWKGLNWLGEVLMRVREWIQKDQNGEIVHVNS